MEKHYKLSEIACQMGLSVITLRRRCWAGMLQFTRIGDDIRVSESQLTDFLEGRTNPNWAIDGDNQISIWRPRENIAHRLHAEARIVWREDVSQIPYVREVVVENRQRRGPIRLHGYNGRVIGWSELFDDAPKSDWGYIRRAFTLAPHDPYKNGGNPSEAVTPSSIQPGVPGEGAAIPRK